MEDTTKRLILMVGLPQSGKTTEALRMGYPIVSPDAVRMTLGCYPFHRRREGEVWSVVWTTVRTLFNAGHDTVILDSNNVTAQYRRNWHKAEWSVRYKLVECPVDECLNRAIRGGKEYLIPVIEKLATDWAEVSDDAEPGFSDRLVEE